MGDSVESLAEVKVDNLLFSPFIYPDSHAIVESCQLGPTEVQDTENVKVINYSKTLTPKIQSSFHRLTSNRHYTLLCQQHKNKDKNFFLTG